MIPLLPIVIFGISGAILLGKEHLDKKKLKKEKSKIRTNKVKNINALLETQKITEDAKEITRYLKTSSTGLILAVSGSLFYSPLLLASIPFIAYGSIPIIKDSYTSLIKNKEAHISQIDTIVVVSSITSGFIVISAAIDLLYYGSLSFVNRTKNKSRKKLITIFDQKNIDVWILKNDIEISIPIEKVAVGDYIVIRAGEIIPIDGIIAKGNVTIDQHILTGESQPIEKQVGDEVFAMSTLLSGNLVIRVVKTGNETIAAKITDVINNTDNYEELLLTRGDKIANKTVCPSYGIAGLSLVTGHPHAIVMALNSNFSEVIRLSSPISMLNYMELASNNDLLIKDGRSLELLQSINTVIFDKTGTLTLEQPHIGNIYTYGRWSENDILQYAASAEQKQVHPIGKAILSKAKEYNLELYEIDEASYQIGYGISVNFNKNNILVGSYRYMEQLDVTINDDISLIQKNSIEKGYSLIYISINGVLSGILELKPTIRPEAYNVIQKLKKRGLEVYILSGDNISAVKYIADELEVENFIAETLPEDKANVIESLQEDGDKICFIGDGINDSIALKKATVSISFNNASSVAIDTAQIILLKEDLTFLLNAFDISKEFANNQKLGLGSIVALSGISMTGAVFFSLTLQTTMIFYLGSIVSGLGISMLPKLKNKNKNKNK
ncbi:MAG: heavy metal translocating P-type ATPase [Campylobacterota bacterium]|nr:heavy metal translocating P-type ATPase [Campylobacterota bacterium]